MGQPFLVTLCFFEISPPAKTFHNLVPSHHSRPIFLQVPSVHPVLKPNCTPANTLGFPALLYVCLWYFLHKECPFFFLTPKFPLKRFLRFKSQCMLGY